MAKRSTDRPKSQWKIFINRQRKKIKITETELPIRSLIQQRLYERLPIRPDPTRPYVRSSPSSSLSGTAGPQLSKVVVYDNGPTTVWFGRGDDVSEKAKMCLRFLGGKQKMRNSKVIIKKKSKTKTEKNTAKNGIIFVSDRAGRTI